MQIYLFAIVVSIVIIGSFSEDPVKKFTCPPDVREVNCLVDPCFNQKCLGDPKAECISSYCGGCNAVWLTPNGKKAHCNRKRKSRCPNGQREVQCFRDPCQGEKCPGDSTAKCISNYCGGCNFSWKKSNGKPAQC